MGGAGPVKHSAILNVLDKVIKKLTLDHLAEKNPHRFLLEKTLPDMRLSKERCLLRTKHGWRIYRRFDLSALNIIAICIE